MLGTDHQIYEKFVGINSIVRIPALRFEITSGRSTLLARWAALRDEHETVSQSGTARDCAEIRV